MSTFVRKKRTRCTQYRYLEPEKFDTFFAKSGRWRSLHHCRVETPGRSISRGAPISARHRVRFTSDTGQKHRGCCRRVTWSDFQTRPPYNAQDHAVHAQRSRPTY